MEVAKSNFTVALKKGGYFASAFASIIVFGILDFNGSYKDLHYFEISSYFLEDFCSAICSFFFFVNSNGESEGQGLIRPHFEEANLIYFWQGHICVNDDGQKKIFIVFGIEQNSNIIFKVNFNLDELNNLILSVFYCVPFTMFFSENEFSFFYFVMNLPNQDFNAVQSLKEIENLVNIYCKNESKSVTDVVKQKLMTLFSFYKEQFKSARCLKDLHSN